MGVAFSYLRQRRTRRIKVKNLKPALVTLLLSVVREESRLRLPYKKINKKIQIFEPADRR